MDTRLLGAELEESLHRSPGATVVELARLLRSRGIFVDGRTLKRFLEEDSRFVLLDAGGSGWFLATQLMPEPAEPKSEVSDEAYRQSLDAVWDRTVTAEELLELILDSKPLK